MRPLKRAPVSKGKSSAKFRRQVGRTKGANMQVTPMRGGFRL